MKEVNVIGKRLDEAIDEVEKALDEALVAGARAARHPRARHRPAARRDPRAPPQAPLRRVRARAADAREGGNGATMVELK